MNLASMLNLDEAALICDLAETYHILDWTRVPVKTLGILCSGFDQNARIMQKAAGSKTRQLEVLLAGIYDELRLMRWSMSKKPTKANMPESIAELLMHGPRKEEKESMAFDNPEQFEAYRKTILERIRKHG